MKLAYFFKKKKLQLSLNLNTYILNVRKICKANVHYTRNPLARVPQYNFFIKYFFFCSFQRKE